MSQLLNWRFFAALAALAGLALLLNAVLVDDDSIADVVEPEVPERDIDFIAPVYSVEMSEEFEVTRRGVTKGYADFVIDEGRVVRVVPGTLGTIDCDRLDEVDQCAIFADLLGEAVVWFAVLPQGPRNTAEVPEIIDLDEGDALLSNGWRIGYPSVIERDCGDEDIPSFADFLRRYGPGSVSTVDLETQEVVSVQCSPRAAKRVDEDRPAKTDVSG